MQKRTVVLDFDGVIHSYFSGWRGPTIIPDEPVPGIAQAIKEIREQGYRLIVVSSRCNYDGGNEAIKKFLSEHNITVDGIQSNKPPAVCYVDDRAICFDGDSSLLPTKIKAFRPWTKQGKTITGSLKTFHDYIIEHRMGIDGDDLIMNAAGFATIFDLYSHGKIDELDVINYANDRNIPTHILFSYLYLYEAGKNYPLKSRGITNEK